MAISIFPPDFASPVGQVRNLIPDTVQHTDPKDPTAQPTYYFEDAQIQAFLVTARNKIYLAAALALLALAGNESMVSKKIRTEDLQTDGPAVAGELRRLAEVYKAQQKEDDAADDADDSFWVIDYTYEPLRNYRR